MHIRHHMLAHVLYRITRATRWLIGYVSLICRYDCAIAVIAVCILMDRCFTLPAVQRLCCGHYRACLSHCFTLVLCRTRAVQHLLTGAACVLFCAINLCLFIDVVQGCDVALLLHTTLRRVNGFSLYLPATLTCTLERKRE